MDANHTSMQHLVDTYDLAVENAKTKDDPTTSVVKEAIDNILRKTDTLLGYVLIADVNNDENDPVLDIIENDPVLEMVDPLIPESTDIDELVTFDMSDILTKAFTSTEDDSEEIFKGLRDKIQNKHVLTTVRDIPEVAKTTMLSLTHVYLDETSPLGFGFEVLHSNDTTRSVMM